MPLSIEPAGPQDVDALARLRHALYDEYGEADVPLADYLPTFRAFLDSLRWG